VSTSKRRRNSALIAAVLAAVALFGLLDRAPLVDYNPAVTSPSTRGFGDPCTASDREGGDVELTAVDFYGYVRAWNVRAYMPVVAAIRYSTAVSDYRPDQSVGTYNCRLVRGSTSTWSHHAWAVAVDFDPAQNCLGCALSTSEIAQHPEFVRAWEKFGFVWGGSWSSRPDTMHFEYDGPALPQRPSIDIGDSGPAVRHLRALLEAVGLPHEDDGPYGGRDLLGVVAFQRQNGIWKIEHARVSEPTWVLLMFAARGLT
jgi:hypothetical protein